MLSKMVIINKKNNVSIKRQFISYRIIDKSKNECPLCRAMVANTRSKLYKQAIVKQDNQDMKVLLKESILNFIIKA